MGAGWNVRVAILKSLKLYFERAAIAVSDAAPTVILSSVTIIQRILPVLQTVCIRDAKYAAVRVAALDALYALTKRLIAAATAADAVSAIRALFDELKADRDPHVLRLLQDLNTL